MKKLGITLFVLFVLLNTLIINAQICRVIDNPSFPSVPSNSFGDPSQLSLFQPTEVRTIYIAVHIVRSSSGAGGISTANIATSIQQLNTSFTEVLIQFVHNQTDYIDNDTYYNLTQNEYLTLKSINNVSNKINVYFVPEADGFNGISQYVTNSCAVTNAAAINGSTLAHEIGHNFYLYHTHGIGTQEFVNQTNCSTAGDYLCDTPAEPYNNNLGILNYVNGSCTYTGTFRDPNNELYTPDTQNFMGYSLASCRVHFSQLQIEKMNQTLVTYLSYLINTQVPLSNKIDGNLITNVPNVRTSTLTVVGVTTVNSGSSANLLDGNSYDIKTNQERFPAYSTFGNIKHNNWNFTTSQYKLNENYTVIRTASPYRDANFKTMKYSLIHGNVDNAITSGSFQFQDPWYVKSDGTQPGNYWIPCTAVYEPNGKDGSTEKGVFLDQPYTGNNPVYYSVKVDAVQDFYLSQTGKTHKFYFQSWSYDQNKATLQNPTLNETPVVFTQENSTITANLKGTQLSNQTNAYSNKSQRRFVQTPDGVKHICYESMSKVWYELSTDGGTTWILGNSGKPLSGVEAKNPSMSFYANQLGIVWQEKNSGSTNIKFVVFYGSNYSSSVFNTVVSDDCAYSTNANPVVAWGYNGKAVIIWSGLDYCENIFGSIALKYAYGDATSNGIGWLSQCAIVGTDENSVNPTITCNYLDTSSPTYFHFAWQQVVNTSTSKINYCKLYASGNNLTNTTFEEASLNSGYSKNYNPVIVLKKLGISEYIYVTWLGNRTSPTTETRVLLKYKLGSNWSVTGVYGTSPVQNFSINKGTTITNNQEPLALCWSQPNGSSFYNKLMKSPGSGILTLSTTGKDMQINNGTTFTSMFANSFSSVSSPYSFNLSQNFGSINKENNLAIFNGREGVVGIDGAQFYFALGDISANGQNINFITVPDTLNIGSLEAVNNYFESEPFTINSSSNLTYGVQYGITDSTLCSSALSGNNQITFKVELLDNLTNELLGVFDEITYSEQNVYQYNNIGYQVNLSGIGNRTLKFRLATNTNGAFGYSLSNRTADQNILAKGNYQTVNYQGNLAVTEYNLEQNYPNPFNPSTTIKFQLPQDGFVTLKIYDILGNEITTLINEEKAQGRYEVNFNASNLASGIYIYKIQAGSFVSSKKMILIK